MALVEAAMAPMAAIKNYHEFARVEVERVRRNLNGLSNDDKARLIRSPEVQVRAMEEAHANNSVFLEAYAQIVRDCTAAADGLTAARGGLGTGTPSSKALQGMLQTVVREWSQEGLAERRECLERLVGALERHLGSQRDVAKATGQAAPRVLCPGAQLARLPFEVLSRGYQAEACEGRSLLYFGAEMMRRHGGKKGAFTIQPFALNTCNRVGAEDHVRRIQVPDVDVTAMPQMRFGDLPLLYDAPEAKSAFDAVLTAFALDSTQNILRYVRTVAHAVRPGGLWANFGPLAYDAEHDEAHGTGLELSWEELKHAISVYFDVTEEACITATHSASALSMMQLEYSCIYFFAVRNSKAAEGIGER